jgi:hypothetical protein
VQTYLLYELKRLFLIVEQLRTVAQKKKKKKKKKKKMQEPTIYRQPVGLSSADNDMSTLPSEENTVGSHAYPTSTVGGDTVSEKDYHVFVIPEG